MKRFVVLFATLVLTWPALAAAQEEPKPAQERDALRERLSGVTQELVPAVAAAREEDPRSGVARAWARWLEANPQAVADGEAPRYAMIVAGQAVEPTLREVSDYLREDREENPAVCADGIDAVESERDDLSAAIAVFDAAELDDLSAVSEGIGELSDALEACRVELAAGAENVAPSGPTAREPEKRDRAEAPRAPRAQPVAAGQQASDEPDLDARSTNDLIQRIEAIEEWNERLGALVETVDDLHAETATAMDAGAS